MKEKAETGTLVKCDWCGVDFPANPNAFSESGISMFEQPDDAEAWKGEQLESPVRGVVLSDSDKAALKGELGLDDEQLRELLETGSVNTGFSCVCPKCMDDSLHADD